MEDEALKTQAQVNKIDTFKFAFEETFLDKLIERMGQNPETISNHYQTTKVTDYSELTLSTRFYCD